MEKTLPISNRDVVAQIASYCHDNNLSISPELQSYLEDLNTYDFLPVVSNPSFY